MAWRWTGRVLWCHMALLGHNELMVELTLTLSCRASPKYMLTLVAVSVFFKMYRRRRWHALEVLSREVCKRKCNVQSVITPGPRLPEKRNEWVTFCKRRISKVHIDGSVQDCSISIVNALEILQSCTNPSILLFFFPIWDIPQIEDYILTLYFATQMITFYKLPNRRHIQNH